MSLIHIKSSSSIETIEKIFKPLFKKFNIEKYEFKIKEGKLYIYVSQMPTGFLEAFKKIKNSSKFPNDISFQQITTRLSEFDKI